MIDVGLGRMLRFLDTLDQRYFAGAPPLGDGETVTWSCPMGYVIQGVARGGVLYLTVHRVLFVPNVVERRLGVKTWDAPRDQVERIERIAEPNLLARGLGDSFVVRTSSGDVAEFSVYDAESTVRELQAAFSSSGPPGR